jgi:large subunit ribosomal protein L20
MSRVKRGTTANKRRNYLLKRAKGFNAKGKSTFRLAKQRLLKAERNAYISRRLIKRDFRRLWITRINGALDSIGSSMNYSTFINLLNKSDINLNRKMLSELAIENLDTFKSIVETVTGQANATPKAKTIKEVKSEVKPEVKAEAKPATVKVAKIADVKTTDVTTEAVESTEAPIETIEVAEVKVTKPKKSTTGFDDLKVVEGIGPAIEKLLHEAGITTYDLLAKSEYDNLKKILSDAGARYAIHNPLTWAQQSALAADGKFDELETLKKELVNGK